MEGQKCRLVNDVERLKEKKTKESGGEWTLVRAEHGQNLKVTAHRWHNPFNRGLAGRREISSVCVLQWQRQQLSKRILSDTLPVRLT